MRSSCSKLLSSFFFCMLYYYILGTETPFTCPPGRVIDKIGAGFEWECDVCPAGKICPLGAIIAQDCTAGYFCPYDDIPYK